MKSMASGLLALFLKLWLESMAVRTKTMKRLERMLELALFV